MPRNAALDSLRATALLLMSLIHMWRFIVPHGAIGSCLLFVGELAPFPFFIAFGMTQNLLVRKERRQIAESLAVLGCIAALHSYFLLFTAAWEFLFFLWAASLLVVIGSWIGVSRRQYLMLALVIVCVNAVIPLGASALETFVRPNLPSFTRNAIAGAQRVWVLPGPFFPLPWAALVFFGVALGTQYVPRREHVFAAAGVAMVALGLGALARSVEDPSIAARLELEKWTATSTYVLLGGAVTILVYALFARAARGEPVAMSTAARFLSERLIEGTILQYAVVEILVALGRNQIAGWTRVLILSLVNVVGLAAGLKLFDGIERLCAQPLDALRRRLGFQGIAGLALTAWIALLVARLRIPLANLRWVAYAGLVLLAVWYRFEKTRRYLSIVAPGGGAPRPI